MKLTTKFRYGSRAILEIARHGNDHPIKRKEISQNQDIPDSYLENILIDLKKSGLIKAIRGPKGGFILKGNPEEISLLDVAEVFEGSLSPVDCIDDATLCNRADNCPTRPIWKQLKAAQRKVLKKANLGKMLKKMAA